LKHSVQMLFLLQKLQETDVSLVFRKHASQGIIPDGCLVTVSLDFPAAIKMPQVLSPNLSSVLKKTCSSADCSLPRFIPKNN
jgi:hypothetical protein